MVVGAYAVLTGIFGASTTELFVVLFELLPLPFAWFEADDWLALVDELDCVWLDEAEVVLFEPLPLADPPFAVLLFVLDELPLSLNLLVDVITGATVVFTLFVFLTLFLTLELPEPLTEPPAPPAPPVAVALPPVAFPPVAVLVAEPPFAVCPCCWPCCCPWVLEFWLVLVFVFVVVEPPPPVVFLGTWQT